VRLRPWSGITGQGPTTMDVKNSPSNSPLLAYRITSFCKCIGIGRTKFYQLVREGKVRTIVIGRRRLVPAHEAERLVREGCE